MIFFLITALVVLADFLAKRGAIAHLMPINTIPLWDGVFHLTYVENRGAAFGIMQNQRWFFIVLTVAVLAVVLFVCFRYKEKHPLLCTALSLLTGGAVGNMIDRIVYGYVVDFFDFRLIDFPVFNIADIFIVIGAGLLAIYFIFFDGNKEEKKDYERENC